ncbi:MAG: gliding motility-associated C-terminal domain-containing protein [Saprospiraceae bacterium]|nr:gliding motility-associated C-terminal domain-containing protein [Saprospiraceae bacterium]
MMFRFVRTAFFTALLSVLFQVANAQPCPTLNQTATLNSPDCAAGLTPCTVCPGDQITLTATGSGLQPGSCVNWYYGTTNNFNPYNGEGTLLGCSMIESTPPNPCAGGCPLTLGLVVNACGTEENNEFMAILSGGGFYVDDLSVDFDGSGSDIGSDCGWQQPSANTIASIQTFCPNGTVIGVGPGQSVPGGVPVMIFPSASFDFNYNFGGLCPLSPVIYVMQSSCSPGSDVFPQSGGSISTTVSISCGCSDNTTYNTNNLVGGDGAFVTDAGFPTFYGNAGCGFPNFPGGGGGGGGTPPIQVLPFTFTVTEDMCNGGPYYVVGIVEPLPDNCSQPFTNYMGFNVPCPMPELSPADLCQNSGLYNLSQLVTPPGLQGTWSGPGVTGTNFNPVGQLGAIELTFTPNGTCTTPASTTLNVFEAPTASFEPLQPVCAGQSTNMTINFTGAAPWNFNLFANGLPLGNYVADNSPFTISVSPTGPTNYVLSGLSDLNCNGPNAFTSVTVVAPPTGILSLAGSGNLCAGQSTQLSINFNNGSTPYTYQLAANNVPGSIQTANTDPFTVTVTPSLSTTYTLVQVGSSGCTSTGTGSAQVAVLPGAGASIPTDTLPYCNGQTVNVPVTFTGAGPYQLFYTINGVLQPVVTVPDSIKNYNLPIVPPTDTTIIRLDSLHNNDCEGTVSGILTFIETPPPTAALSSGGAILCGPGSVDLTINFTGTGPFIFNATANGSPLGTDTASTNPFIWNVPVLATTTFALTSVSANGCAGQASGQALVEVETPVTATISGGGQTCTNGSDSLDVLVTFTGDGPYTFILTINNVAQPSVTTTSNPYIFKVKPNIGTFYVLQSVSNSNCPGTVSGLATVFVFTPPTADMLGDATFCDSAQTEVIIDFTGTGPFSVVWSQDGAVQPQITTFDDPFIIPVSTNTTTFFELLSVESPGCIGDPDGTAEITINYAPSFANLDFNCNPVQNNYTVTFDVIGATLPLTLVSGSGSFTGTQFTSTPISQAVGYNFVFRDANNCGNVTVSGVAGCNCVSDAGDMNLSTVEVCEFQTATAIHLGGEVLDGDDSLRFILHSNPATPVGTIYGWNTAPVFSFVPPMQTGTTYYISAIAGNLLPDGTIDLNDPCLSVAQGTPVVFNAPPTATIDTVAQICAGESFDLPVDLSGIAPFTLEYALDGVPQSVINNIGTNPYVLTLQPADSVEVSIVTISDQRCTVSGSSLAQIAVSPLPQINNVTTNCDFDNNTYTVSFELTGTPPFVINGVAGFIFGNQFTSIPISSTTPAFNIVLEDALDCGQATYTGTANCSCQTNAGTMDGALVEACAGSVLNALHNGDQFLQANDALEFVLHTSPGFPLGTILATNTTPNFAFQPGVTQPGTTYYVTAIAGNNTGNGTPDPNDPCYALSNSAPVRWKIAPGGVLSGSFDICPGEAHDLSLNFTGTAPFTYSYTINGAANSGTSTQNTSSIATQVTSTTVYILTAVADSAGCAGSVSGQATVTVHPTPEIVNFDLNCSPDNSTYVIEFDVINADLPLVNISLQPGTYDPATGHYTSGPLTVPNPYVVIVTDAWLCGKDSIGGIPVCNCLTEAGTMDQTAQDLCFGEDVSATPVSGEVLDNNDTLLYFLVTTPNPLSWQYLDTSATPDFTFNAALITPNVPYYIVAMAGDAIGAGIDLNDPCLSYAVGPAVLWHPPVTGELNGFDQICAGDTTFFVAHLTGGAPYQLIYSANGINQTPQISLGNNFGIQVIPINTVTFELVSISSVFGCTGTVSGNATVEVIPPPAILDVIQICDYANDTYTVLFQIGNGSAPNPVYTVSGLDGTLNDSTFTSITLDATEDFSFTVTNATGCSSDYSGVSMCLCISDAGALDTAPQDACVGETININQTTAPSLDPDDVLVYVLCEDPADLPNGVIGTSATPSFSFQSNMVTEQTYYVVTLVGNPDGNGLVDLNDPCRSESQAVPLVFHAIPTANLSGDTTVCAGGGAVFQIQFTGAAPFQFVFANNNVNQSPITAPQNTFNLTGNNIQNPLVYTLVSVQDAWCPGNVTGQATVNILQPSAALSGTETVCTGESATLSIDLQGATAYNLSLTGGPAPIVLNNVFNDTTIMVNVTATTTYTLTNFSSVQPNCPGPTSGTATITLDEPGFGSMLSDYNGFQVSCPFSEDGSIEVIPGAGVPPFTVDWSTGDTGVLLEQLPTGTYALTLTDNEGCTAVDSFNLSAPPPFFTEFSTAPPTCAGDTDGSLVITGVAGSVSPYTFQLSGNPVTGDGNFPVTVEDLPAGPYLLITTDANGCERTDSVEVPEAMLLTLNLGPDTTIHYGDSVLLIGVTNALFLDSLLWTPVSGLMTPGLSTTWSKPERSTIYNLFIMDERGCVAEDEIVVRINRKGRVFVPNIIRPGAGANGVLTVFAGPEVANVNFLRVYDRWGSCLYEGIDLAPNAPGIGWDGRYRGQDLNPGVYVYVVEVRYLDGSTELFKGDVTLMR